MKFIKFNDKVIDTTLFIQLQDLVHLLMEDNEYELNFGFGHYIELENKELTVSHFWDNRSQEDKLAGLKTDILLRCLGTIQHTNKTEIFRLIEKTKDMEVASFAISLFSFLEDLRIEEHIKEQKPGTKKWFSKRTKLLHHYFRSQISANVSKNFLLDSLFCMLLVGYLSNTPDPIFEVPEELSELIDMLKPTLYSFYDVQSTEEVVDLVLSITFKVSSHFSSRMVNNYYVLPYHHTNLYNQDFDDLKRKDKLVNNDVEKMKKDESNVEDEKFSTWHREQENGNRNQGFLRFELEQGTATNLLGNGLREGDDGDQALGQIQGSSVNTKNNDHSIMESLDKQFTKGKKGLHPFGEENKFAISLPFEIHKPLPEETLIYEEIKFELFSEIKLLQKTISKTLEHKQNAMSTNKQYGRLSKNFLSILFESHPRVFFKKNEASKDIDAVFTLLVDCSASMNDKMQETIKGIVLFHEVLKSLNIPHSVVGFWEDSFESTEEYHPNFFQEVVSFQSSLLPHVGAEILQLEPREDNRDGFSIRQAKEKLLLRNEKHKFLLVFSDGEPSAHSYNDNGIVDTFEAVSESRKLNIDTIGFYLSNEPITETEETYMKNIYGEQHLLVPNIQELPFVFSSLLKRLIMKSI